MMNLLPSSIEPEISEEELVILKKAYIKKGMFEINIWDAFTKNIGFWITY